MPVRNHHREEDSVSVEKRVRNGKTSCLVRWRDTVGASRSRTFDREVDATAYDGEINRQRRQAMLVDPALGAMTVGEFAELWLGWQTQLTPKTLAGYRSLLAARCCPTGLTSDWRTSTTPASPSGSPICAASAAGAGSPCRPAAFARRTP